MVNNIKIKDYRVYPSPPFAQKVVRGLQINKNMI